MAFQSNLHKGQWRAQYRRTVPKDTSLRDSQQKKKSPRQKQIGCPSTRRPIHYLPNTAKHYVAKALDVTEHMRMMYFKAFLLDDGQKFSIVVCSHICTLKRTLQYRPSCKMWLLWQNYRTFWTTSVQQWQLQTRYLTWKKQTLGKQFKWYQLELVVVDQIGFQ